MLQTKQTNKELVLSRKITFSTYKQNLGQSFENMEELSCIPP